jgi:glycosyltransferase involved in cell wall biosynthesis
MKNLAVLCPNQTDATSFYRGIGVLSEVRRKRDNLQLMLITEVNWASLKMCDGLFLQRPFTNAHLRIAEMTKRNGLPLWVDYDDDLFSVPDWNPSYSTYSKKEIQQNIATIVAMADKVSVSTYSLGTKLQPLNNKIVVIPNAFDNYLFKHRPEINPNRNPLIMWRGSKTHKKDLNIASEACITLAQSNPELTWLFIGDTPWFADYMPHKSTICCEALDPIEYWEFLGKTQPTIMIIPLDDCDFNKSKSNIAWQEGSYCGAECLAPNWLEWQKPGITNYKDNDDFLTQLQTMILKKAHACNNSYSWQNIQETLQLNEVNKKRILILEELGL